MPEAGPRRRHRDWWASGPASRAETPTNDLSAALALVGLVAVLRRRRRGVAHLQLPVAAGDAGLAAAALAVRLVLRVDSGRGVGGDHGGGGAVVGRLSRALRLLAVRHRAHVVTVVAAGLVEVVVVGGLGDGVREVDG